TQGIESAQKFIDQMKATANSALQSTAGSNASASTSLSAQGVKGTFVGGDKDSFTKTIATEDVNLADLINKNGAVKDAAESIGADDSVKLTDLTDSNGKSLGIAVGDK